MTIYHLYIKTHKITGLRYLGKTKQDPYTYFGSGTYWMAHLNKHGYEVTTEILKECTNNEEIKQWGLYYSELYNIVESAEWANLKPESGDGGIPSEAMRAQISASLRGRKQSTESIEKRRNSNRKPRPSMQGRKWTTDHCAAISRGNVGRKKSTTENMRGNKSESHKKNISLGKKGKKLAVVTCPHCDKTGGRGNMNRYHFGFCKLISSLKD